MGFWFFFPKNPRFWKFKLDFFPLEKVFEILWRNTMNKRLLNYLWLKFQEICGIFFFTKYPRFWKLKSDFFPIEKVFRKTANIKKISYFKLIMSEISANLKKLFREQKPPILKLEVGFFSDRKSFSQIFENTANFFHLDFISIKKKISEKLFGSSFIIHSD